MERLVMRNFGPINELDIEVKNFQVFIGPQTSGKSTICKTIYFFKSLRDDLIRYLYEPIEKRKDKDPIEEYEKVIRGKFVGIWGTTLHLKNAYLRYYYAEDSYITVSLEENTNIIRTGFSPYFLKIFHEIIPVVRQSYESFNQLNSAHHLVSKELEKRTYLSIIENLANQLFNDDQEIVFVPAGRSLLSVLSGQLQNISDRNIDLLMRDFLFRISESKSLFSKSLHEIVLEKSLTQNEDIDFPAVETAQRMIQSILNGEYRNDRDGEKIFISPDKYVKLNYSSSGQQESLWILHLIFLFILDNKKCFFIIEEPEAHLYPEAQKKVIDLISLLFNHQQNKILITTHSPYILASVNNLIMAANVGKNDASVQNVIDKNIWINIDQVGAYFIREGLPENIIDPELLLIKNEAIDSASTIINREFDMLYEMQ
jgi:predicted ATP-dependent endonuclease of OLD family